MAKYSYELKKKVVKAYLLGKGGYETIAKQYNIPNKAIIERWVANYRAFGDDGLRPLSSK